MKIGSYYSIKTKDLEETYNNLYIEYDINTGEMLQNEDTNEIVTDENSNNTNDINYINTNIITNTVMNNILEQNNIINVDVNNLINLNEMTI